MVNLRLTVARKIIGSVLVVVVLMTVLALYSVDRSQKALQESVGKSSTYLAEEMMERINQGLTTRVHEVDRSGRDLLVRQALKESNQEFEGYANLTDYISSTDEEWISTPEQDLNSFMQELIGSDVSSYLREVFLKHYQREHGFMLYGEVFITNKYGANVALTGRTTDYYQADEEWWQITKTEKHYVSGIEYDESAGIQVISISQRIDDSEGNFLGIIKSIIDITKIARLAEIGVKKHETTEIRLITKDGRLIYSTTTYKPLEDVTGQEYYGKIGVENSYFTVKEGVGNDKLFSYAHSRGFEYAENQEWILVVGYDVSDVLKPVFELRNNILSASLVLIGASGIIALFLSRSVSGPIKKLTTTVKEIGTETLDVEFNPGLLESEDEIGELAKTFNNMIIERRRIEKKLVQQERLAAIGRLASVVGHELRNPLGVINNSAYYLDAKLGDLNDPKVERHLEILEREVQRSNNIISDLLDFARAPQEPSKRPVKMGRIVEDALERVEIPGKVNVETNIVDIPQLSLDEDMILRVIINLVSNAIDAMPEGGTLEISLSKDKDKDEVVIDVSDTGVGISEENKDKMFTPLFSTKAKGIGLGLYVTKELVEAHNGRITFDSTEGKGTVFTFTLPMEEE